MIYFSKPGQTENLHRVQKEEFSITCYMCDTLDKRPSIFIKETHLLVREDVA
jgi:hypothetical protein